MENHKLLPCPFCGGEAKMAPAAFENEDLAHKYADTVGIRCIKCGISTPPLKKEDAVELWNWRYIHGDIGLSQKEKHPAGEERKEANPSESE